MDQMTQKALGKYICYLTKTGDIIYFNPIAWVENNSIKLMDKNELGNRFPDNTFKNFGFDAKGKNYDLNTENNSLIVYTVDKIKTTESKSQSSSKVYKKYWVEYNDENKHKLFEENIFYAVGLDDYEEDTNKEYLQFKDYVLDYIYPGDQVFLERGANHWYGPILVKSINDVESDPTKHNGCNGVIVLQDIKNTVQYDNESKNDNKKIEQYNIKLIPEPRGTSQVMWKLFIPIYNSDRIKSIAQAIEVISELEQERDGLDKEISELGQKKDGLDKEISELEQKKDELTSKVSDLEAKIKQRKDDFDDYLNNNISKRMAEITIDGFLSSEMLKAAAKWENGESDQHRERLMENMQRAINEIEENEKPDTLINNLCTAIQTVRPQYDRNTIINIAICITQGFLTVFSGEPGCGKTSICNYFGQALGLNSIYNEIIKGNEGKENEENREFNREDREFVNRYTVVSVERGWTTKRDLIGYYNPLSKAFDKSNRKVYDALYQLDLESSNSKLPYLILLDEANLSPMEYYWSDFITICDKLNEPNNDEQAKSKEPVQVNLGGDFVFNIPETLRFVATINNDHTTETLSPRLIDRAWVVTLPSHDENEPCDGVTEIQGDIIISWDSLCKAFAPYLINNNGCNMTNDQKIIYNEVLEKLHEQRIVVSYRVKKAIERYLAVASVIFEAVKIVIIRKSDEKTNSNKENSSNSQSDRKEIPISVEYSFGETEETDQIKRSFAINVSESYPPKEDKSKPQMVEKDIIAMDYAILQRILPKLSGSGESFEKWLNEFKDLLLENNLFMSANKVDEIIKRGNDQLKYYQFFC